MMKRLIYSMFLILSVVTLFTACQEKEKPPITPETSGITREELQALVTHVDNINSKYYITGTYNAMKDKLEAAKTLLTGSPSSKQIVDAYDKLLATKNALERVPSRTVVNISIQGLIEDTLYLISGRKSYVNASAIGVDWYSCENNDVSFQYNEKELKALAVDEIISSDENTLIFETKSTLEYGTTVSLTIKSVGNPSVSKTISLKVVEPEKPKSTFIKVIDDLPNHTDISYEHYEAIDKAFDIYNYYLWSKDKEDPDIQTAYTKLEECENTYYSLPSRLRYSFKGDVCTLVVMKGKSDEMYAIDFEFVAKGAFPAGVYTQKVWTEEESWYTQARLTLNGDKTGLGESREAEDPNGTGTTEWKVDATFTTYTFDGNKNRGGMFVLTRKIKDRGEPKLSTKSSLRKVRKLVW